MEPENNKDQKSVSPNKPSDYPPGAKVSSSIAQNSITHASLSIFVENGDHPPTGHAAVQEMGDNRETEKQTGAPLPGVEAGVESSFKEGPMKVLMDELKAIRAKTDTLDKIEATTSSLASQFVAIADRTTKLEASVEANSTKVEANSTKLTGVSDELASLRATVDLQGRAIVKLTTMKADLIKRNNDTIDEMNELIGMQREQVNSFQASTQRVEENILVQVEEKIEEKIEANISTAPSDPSLQSLRDQAYSSRRNLVITGMEEDPNKSSADSAKELFKTLGMGNLPIGDAYRLGSSAREDGNYCRPILVKFKHLPDRNKIWRKRSQLTPEGGAKKIRVQADLPKALRGEMNIMYRIIRAAASFRKYQGASVRNYALQLNGREYSPKSLERLPKPLRPSTISSPRSDTALAFFSKYSPLSNHHPSIFNLQGHRFHSFEQYLALKKAQLSGVEANIEWALNATDPVEAKALLHSLREDHVVEWDQNVEAITLDGLRAKFAQNEHLLTFLRNTGQLQLGEASCNSRWGIGLNLNDPDVLDTTKWDSNGNLLGKCLMLIRDELCPRTTNSISKEKPTAKNPAQVYDQPTPSK